MSAVSDAARASVFVGDYVGVDAASKINAIGLGANIFPIVPQTGQTAPIWVCVIVEVPVDHAGSEYALSLELRDLHTDSAVTLPNAAGQPDALRVQQIVRVERPMVAPGMSFAEPLPARAQIVMAFPNGLPLPIRGSYEWRLEIDGQHRPDWSARLNVPGPPPGPVFGGPAGPADIPNVVPPT